MNRRMNIPGGRRWGLLLVMTAAGLFGQATPADQATSEDQAAATTTGVQTPPAAQTPAPTAQPAPPPPDQAPPPAPPAPEPKPHLRRWSVGVRGRWWTAQPFKDNTIQTANAKLDTATSYTTTSSAGRYAIGPVADFNISKNFAVQLEAYFENTAYSAIQNIYTGSSPATGTLETTLTENTHSSYWDFPLLAVYQGFGIHKIRARVVLEGGGVLRKLNRVWTGNDTNNVVADTTAYNEIPTVPAHDTVKGGVIGVGLRWIDEVHLKITLGGRYTYWSAPIFDANSTLSRTRQIEAGLSFIY
jgi:hypothetical protein